MKLFLHLCVVSFQDIEALVVLFYVHPFGYKLEIHVLGGSSIRDAERDIGCGVGAYKVRRSLLSKTNLKHLI